MGVGFKAQLTREYRKWRTTFNRRVETAAYMSWQTAVYMTPVKTGLLRYSWKLRTSKSYYVPKEVKYQGSRIYPDPDYPVFSFNCDYDRNVYIYNNVRYAPYVHYKAWHEPTVREARSVFLDHIEASR